MCYNTKQSKKAIELEKAFKAEFEKIEAYQSGIFNGFQFPPTPVISNNNPEKIKLFNWGLIPSWAKDKSIRQNTLNAKTETLLEKPSFKNHISQRCLVLIDGFFEWQWLDSKGKQKCKYEISFPEKEAFALGGLWNEWTDPETGELLNTYTILTTEANELMARIHNSKKRMPLIIEPGKEKEWLAGNSLEQADIELMAIPIDNPPVQAQLF